jgi:L-lysine 2,3-aminomutase
MEEKTDVEDAMWPEWQRVWMEERKHSVQLAKLMLDANLAERIARVQEAQVVQLATAMRAIMDRLGLSPEQEDLARQVVPQVLGELATGGVGNGDG